MTDEERWSSNSFLAGAISMRLGIRARLILLTLAFLVIPVLAYISSQEMKRFMLRHQQSSQLIAAQALAASLHGQYAQFRMRQEKSGELTDAAMFIHRATSPFRMDGLADEWAPAASAAREFGRESLLMESGGGFDPATGGFKLIVARWEDHIYLLVSVQDETVIPISRGWTDPGKADHLRLGLGAPGEGERKYIVPVSSDGELSFLEEAPGGGRVERNETLAGRVKINSRGYVMEIALPESQIVGSMTLRIIAEDVDDQRRGRVKSAIGPMEDGAPGLIHLAYFQSPEIQGMLDSLDLAEVEARVFDRARRLRASTGFAADVSGEGEALRILASGAPYYTNIETGPNGEKVVAAAPIKGSDGGSLGVVILERSTQGADSMQDKAMENTLWGAFLAFLAVAAGLVIFSTRLSWRIHRLRGEAERAIDQEGRVRVDGLEASRESGDEIGDLSRSISGLLKKLRSHHDFLAILPRTLKHEINNPLNTITVSLENLAAQEMGQAGSKYIQSAGRGVARLREIVDNLAEAASVEDSIQEEKFEPVDLALILERYMENSAGVYKDRRIQFSNRAGKAAILGSDYRIEQLLDKLMDNALDFTFRDGTIEARLERMNGRFLLTFYNDGPPIPERTLGNMFDSLVADREGDKSARTHLGIGLYVARAICQGHGGGISARNTSDGKGVEFLVILPAARQG